MQSAERGGPLSHVRPFFFNLSDKVCLCREKAGTLLKHSNLVYFDMMLLTTFQYCAVILQCLGKHFGYAFYCKKNNNVSFFFFLLMTVCSRIKMNVLHVISSMVGYLAAFLNVWRISTG